MSDDVVSEWKDKIRLSLEYRKPREKVWNRIYGYLIGKYFDENNQTQQDLDEVCVNMVHTHVRTVVPAVYSRNPDVIVRPQKIVEDGGLADKRALTSQRLSRFMIEELKLKSTNKSCILDGVLTGIAYIKLGYDTEFETQNLNDTTDTPLVDDLLKKMGISLGGEDDAEDSYLLNLKITKEMPWALRVSPRNIIVPAVTSTPDQLWWIAERIILPHDIVLKMDEYNTSDLKPSWSLKDVMHEMPGYELGGRISGDQDEQYDVLYEIYDCQNSKVITIAEGSPNILSEKDFEFGFLNSKFHPYIELRFNEVPDRYYPTGDIEPAESQLLELNDIRTKEARHTRRYNRRYIAKPGFLSDSSIEKLVAGEDGTYVQCESTYQDEPVGEGIWPVADAALPAEVYQYENRIMESLFAILGTNDYASMGDSGQTATEVSIKAARSRVRVEERIDAVSDFVQETIIGIMQMCMKFMDANQVAKYIGDDAQYWQQVTDDDELRSDVNFEIIYGSTLPINKEVDRSQYMQFYAITKNDPYYNQVKIRQDLTRKFDLTNPESYLNEEIYKMLEEQMSMAVSKGLLLPRLINPSGSPTAPASVPDPTKQGIAKSENPESLGGLPGNEPPIPGGRGGTALARSPI
jgi:hypothetical protein